MAQEEGPLCVAEYSEKGGVGKTSLTSGLAAVAADRGLRVGVADLDPRGTLTDELGLDEPERTVNDIFFVDSSKKAPAPRDPAEIVHEVFVPAGPGWPSNIKILPVDRDFANRENDPTTAMEFRLKRALWGLRDEVDIFLLDVPPRAGGKLAGSALLAAKQVLLPSTLTKDGYLGVQEGLRSIAHYNGPGCLNPDLVVSGVVRSMVPRKKEFSAVNAHWQERLIDDFGDLLLPEPIPFLAVREVARTACKPITAAPGRYGKALVRTYGQILDHILKTAKEQS
ncbi:ParA family protein [Streptomyces erythrochromogenes]|uniref:ParA family protein n=1 Tax=Streptomyces erythrochromogenes TaxID=285574 RepID=UPI002F91A772|nr:ParA family protein [Streptomyces erythrochromogenes]WSR88919.1 ParA family protein [Streptomyces erythrochromogenes]